MQFLYPVFMGFHINIPPIIIHFFNFHRLKLFFLAMSGFYSKLSANINHVRICAIYWFILPDISHYFPGSGIQPALYSVNQSAIKQKAQSRVMIYIDNSYSMEAQGKYGTLIERAKMRAHEITSAFPPSTQYLLLTNELEPSRLRWVSRDQLITWMAQIQTTHITQKMGDVIERQQLIASDTNFAYYSFILSDFQKSTSRFGNLKPKNQLQFFLIPFQSSVKQNVFVDSVWFASPGLYPGKSEEMVVRIRNYGESPVNQSIMQFYLNDSLKSSLAFNIEPNASTELKCNFTQGPSGFYSGRVEITDYPVVFDNQMYFSYKINPVIKVLRIGAQIKRTV
jgi:hypothetical protein